MAQRVALYGGSFNPIHIGHLIAARAVAERTAMDRVIFLPSGRPPHKTDQPLIDAHHRAAMVRLAIEGEAVFEYSDFDIACDGPSFTVHTVAHYRAMLASETELYWIIGADTLPELPTWFRIAELVDACGILTAARAGSRPVDWNQLRSVLNENQLASLRAGVCPTPVVEISSTEIRDRVARKKSIRYLVPESVRQYIEDKHLYNDASVG